MNVNVTELSNIWSILGGKYYPSMIWKIRMLTFDASEIESVKPTVSESKTQIMK